ncbi:MAG: urea transporter, partial [Leptospiraceae bacterium]|nr:urea transporter [Leptospiraceae bacterium]
MNVLKILFEATLKAYSTVLFSSSKWVGFFTLLATLFNLPTAITGFLGTLFSNLLALLLGVHEDRIKKGLYGFNGLLVGLSISLYHIVDFNLIVMLFAAIALLIFITLALEHVLGHFFGLPVLSVPFVLVSIITYLAFFNYNGFTVKKPTTFIYDSYFPELPEYALFYIKSLGAIFFQSSPWSGLMVAIIILVFSRIAFLLSIIGFTVGVLFHLLLEGNTIDISAGIVGFNYILTAIAVGGIFLVPELSTFLLAALATIISTLIASFTKIFLVSFNIPVLALPFTTVSLMFLYVARLLRNERLKVVDFLPGSPENNLDYYKTRMERFGKTGLYIRLPFSGRWKVSQGYNGKYTHKDLWKESLDFMAIGPNDALRKGKSNELSDYFTYQLPVLSPCNGRVVKVVNHLNDNPVGELDTKENWGNLVLLEHTPFLFSQLSHLKKESIMVKEGDYVIAGTKLGLAGNSGRSPEPHIHLHFQVTPEIGSFTTPVTFTQYMQNDGDASEIHFNSIPEENDVITNVTADFNMKSFFSLAPGQEYTIEIKKDSDKIVKEKWYAGVDFWGNRYMEDQKNNRIYFFLGQDYFACLDYNGSKGTALFIFYLAVYRIPFSSGKSIWSDRMSYKHFSTPSVRLFKDLIQPFSDWVAFKWKARLDYGESGFILKSEVVKNNGSILYEVEMELDSSIPGIVRAKNN